MTSTATVPAPPARGENPRILLRMKKGSYFGTEIDGKWWKRHRAATFFARGNGEFSKDAAGIRFLRTLTTQPFHIP